MFELILITFVGIAVLGGAYWYLHKVNPDAAQQATDSAVADLKKLAEDTAKAAKDQINK